MPYKHLEVRKAGYVMPRSGISAQKMNRHPTIRTASMSRGGGYDLPGYAYMLFWSSIVFTVALVSIVSLYVAPQVAPNPLVQLAEVPVGKIQLTVDRAGLCRHLLFHNDSGRFEEDGTGRCHSLISEDLLVNSVRTNRADALSRVFKLR
jgi:hypothetical protein